MKCWVLLLVMVELVVGKRSRHSGRFVFTRLKIDRLKEAVDGGVIDGKVVGFKGNSSSSVWNMGQTDSQMDINVYQNNGTDLDDRFKKLVTDGRYDNQFIKKKDKVEQYIEQKENDDVEMKYRMNRRGSDVFSDSYMGDYYLISPSSNILNNRKKSIFQKQSFYLNDYSLYFTNVSKKNDYRGIVGSIEIKKMINMQQRLEYEKYLVEEEVRIYQGQCCDLVSNIRLLVEPQKEDDYKGMVMKQEYRDIVEQQEHSLFGYQDLVCIEIMYRVGVYDRQQMVGVCSRVSQDIQRLRQKLIRGLIKYVMVKKGVQDVDVMFVERDEVGLWKQKIESKYKNYVDWSYDEQSGWVDRCRYDARFGLKAPIIIRDFLFNRYQQIVDQQKLNDLLKQKQQNTVDYVQKEVEEEEEEEEVEEEEEQEEEQQEQQDNVSKTKSKAKAKGKNSQNESKSDKLIDIDVDELFVSHENQIKQLNIDLEKDPEKRPDERINYYSSHPTYSYHGLHENYLLGHFGRLSTRMKMKMGIKQNYQAFCMKFKIKSEHLWNYREEDVEIQVLMMNMDDINFIKKRALFNLIGYNSTGWIQFGTGYRKKDAFETEQSIDLATDLVLSIPVRISARNVQRSFFLEFIDNESWFENTLIELHEQNQYDDKQTMKISSKDIESAFLQQKKKRGSYELGLWQSYCFPGSLKCLFKQFPKQMSFYYYKSTTTNPPCTKQVEYYVLKNSYYISQFQFDDLRQNVFMFRSESRNSNQYRQEMGLTDVREKRVFRIMDYSEINCELDQEFVEFYKKYMIDRKVVNQLYLKYLDVEDNIRIQVMESIRYIQRNKYSQITKYEENNQWHKWFIFNTNRFYRRIYANRVYYGRILDLFPFINDINVREDFPIINLTNTTYYDSDKNALVMVQGNLQSSYKLSVKNITKVETVVKKSQQVQQTKQQSQTDSTSIKVQFSRIKQKQG